jgi:flagellar biosynthesis regulator FlaF
MNRTYADTRLQRSSTMFHPLLYEAVTRDHMRVTEERRHRELVRRLAVLKRRQRRADSARRAVQLLSVW